MTSDRRFDDLPLWTNLAVLFPLFVWRSAYDSFHEPKWHLLALSMAGLLLLGPLVRWSLLKVRTPFDLPICVCLAATLLAWRWETPDRWVAFVFWARLVMAALLFRLLVGLFTDRTARKSGASAGFDLTLVSCLGVGILLKEWVFSGVFWPPALIWSVVLSLCLALRWVVETRILPGVYSSHEALHRVLDAFLISGVGVAALTVAQDWGVGRWGAQPVSDWRFHLSSTLGNPNEVGGFLSYLIPAVLFRFWTAAQSPHRILWGCVGLVYLYALTTVFTVGAWLGLFVILPLSAMLFARFGGADSFRGKAVWVFAFLSAALFSILQGSLRLPAEGGIRTICLLGGGAVLLGLGVLIFRFILSEGRRLALLALGGLLVVWAILLPPWGIPNHPQGLVEEAVSSPRWQGGFGARRFIWKTTGLMVKDHPIRGIGWGHYYPIHAAYQGALYASTDKPHDRPTVGQVPQVHSDPLQVLAESGPAGSVAFLWLGFAAFSLGLMRRRAEETPVELGLRWAMWTGLGLIAFHSAVDFPLRQPQPALLAVFFLAGLAALAPRKTIAAEGSTRAMIVLLPLALLFGGLGYSGLNAQVELKSGFEVSMQALGMPDSELRRQRLERSAERLEGIRYPLPETHDRWLYLARIQMALGDFDAARASLEEARKHRHSLSLYQTWREYGQLVRDPRIVLDSVRGMIRYNPNWAGSHREAAELQRLLGMTEEARESELLAEKFRVK